MATQQYYINIPKSNWEKFKQHANDGNWAYIWDRVQKRYLPQLIGSVIAFLGLLVGIIYRKKIRLLFIQKRMAQ